MNLSEFDIFKRVSPNLFQVGLVYPDEENPGRYVLWVSHHPWDINTFKNFNDFLDNVNKCYVYDCLYDEKAAKEEFFEYCMGKRKQKVEKFESINDLILKLEIGKYGIVNYNVKEGK